MKQLLSAVALLFFISSFSLHAQVVLNEGLGSTTGADSEFIELFNTGVTDIDISAWTVKIYESDSGASFGDEDNSIEIPANTTLAAGEFYLIGNATFESQYQIIPDLSIPDNSLENSSYTIILKNTASVNQSTVFLTDGGAGDQANDMGAVITPDISIGPDGSFLPAGFSRTTDGAATAQLLDFSPNPSLASTPAYSNSKRNTDLATVSIQQTAAEPGTNAEFLLSLVNQDAPSGGVTVSYTVSGTASAGTDYSDPNAGSIVIPAGNKTAVLTINVIDEAVDDPDETLIVTINSVSGSFMIGKEEINTVIEDNDGSAGNATLISAVQGSGSASPLAGNTVTVEGIVVGDFQGGSGVGIGGFFVQEEDADADGDVNTSEGIFIFDSNLAPAVAVSVGDKVSVTGMVQEFSTNTEITPTAINVISTSNTLPTKTSIDLPLSNPDDYEIYEGMFVTFVDNLFVTEFFNLDRFGEIKLAEGGRFENFTECNTPDQTNYDSYLDDVAARSIILDDGKSGSNVFPIRLPDGSNLSPSNSIRGNDIVSNLCGILDFRFDSYRVQPTNNATLTDNNARPTSSPNVGGNITVATMNVLNYFNGDGLGGGFPTSRGAETFSDFQRQSLKISKAVCKLQADIIGLEEIENDGFGANSALQTLVDDINTECGLNYDFVDPGTTQIGSDEIAVGLIYNTANIAESGTAALLDTPSSLFVGSGTNRVVLAQTFEVINGSNPDFGEEITAAVNHFKSKGSSCGAGDDETDGSGNCNETRRLAAEALVNWLASDPTNSQVADQIILGDLNSYRMEDPIQEIINAGFTNPSVALSSSSIFPCGGDYSYVFDGQWGALDYALTNQSLFPDVTGAASWHVNADEADALDYTTEFNDPSLFAADEFRFSDHDPVVVGLDLNTQSSSGSCLIFDGINDNPIADATYQATTISSTGTVQQNSNVVFQAEQSIILKNGFCAKENFTARIAPCSSNADEDEIENRSIVEEEIPLSTGLSIFPNPLSDYGNIAITLAESSEVSLELFDLSGKLVKTFLDQTMEKGNYQMEVDFSDVVVKGYYLIRMKTGTETQTIKVVK